VSPIRPENRARYPDDWHEISRGLRLGRADNRCECRGECGRGTHGTDRCPNRQGEPAEGTGSRVVLTVAHLDHTPEHSDPDNLRVMCQGCHLHHDRDHHAATRAATRRAALEAAGQLAIDTAPPGALTCTNCRHVAAAPEWKVSTPGYDWRTCPSCRHVVVPTTPTERGK
jgi:hypothetical protein